MSSGEPETNSRFERIIEAYLNALEHGRSIPREQLLADNPDLASELDAFFRVHDQLNDAAASNRSHGESAEHSEFELALPTGSMVGPYRLLDILGRGGMGVVYRAEQTAPVQRHLALKIIKPGFEARSIVARFEAERQALALMDHPNIAKVIDAGTTTMGRPYFAMELVLGPPITKYCDQARLDARQRVELLIPVCHAVQHAHQKGIIHRDLKPSNVIVVEVDGRPVPKIIDFGLAKAIGPKLTEQSLYTDVGAIVGTLEYMSPEQAGLNQADIDTRSDIYALGVILYELLTGSTPLERSDFKQAAVLEMLRLIREVDPPIPSSRISSSDAAPSIAANRSTEPSRLQGLVRGELDWIVMKALDKDRNRRYDSAASFASDLGHYLSDEPVLAGPPSRWYRLKKLIRRNRGTAISTALLAVALIAGVIGTTFGMFRAQRESVDKDKALKSVEFERDEKTKALTAEKIARESADNATKRAIEALQTLTDKTVQRLLSTETGITEETRSFLSTIVDQLEGFTSSTDSSPASRVVLADGLHQIGTLKWRLGDFAGAVEAYHKAIAIWEPLCNEVTDKPDYRRGMADSHSNLGIVLAEQKNFQQSEDAHKRAIDLLTKLIDEFPDNASFKKNLANCRTSYGVMLKDVNRNSETVEQYKLAIELQQALARATPDDLDLLRELSGAQNNLGIELHLAGKSDESIRVLRDVLTSREQIVANGSKDPEDRYLLATSYLNLAVLLNGQGKTEQSLVEVNKSEPLLAAVASEYPAITKYRDTLANALGAAAQFTYMLRRFAESDSVFARFIDVNRQLSREFPDRTEYLLSIARGQTMRGKLLALLKNDEGAEAAYREAIRVFLDYSTKVPADLDGISGSGESHLELGSLLTKQQRHQESIEHFNRALNEAELYLSKEPESKPAKKLFFEALKRRAATRMTLAQYPEALADLDRALESAAENDKFDLRLSRARCVAQSDPRQALQQIDETLSSIEPKPTQLYAAACAIGATIPNLAESEQEPATNRAIELLDKAKAAGLLDEKQKIEQLRDNPDLDPLRERVDFQELFKNGNTF